jgi:hypothetical protein
MLHKIGKTTFRYPKQLPNDEKTGVSQLPCGEYRGVDFLIYSEQASKQVYKKILWWQKD